MSVWNRTIIRTVVAAIAIAGLSVFGLSPANASTCTLVAGASISNCDFSGQDFSGVDLSNTVLIGANFVGANLSGAKLSSSYLTYVDFSNADLTNAEISGAQIWNTNFTGANLTGANLYDDQIDDSNVTTAKMANTTLTYARARGLTGDVASLTSGWRITSGVLVGPSADFNGSNLATADIDGISLAGANFQNAHFTGPVTGTPTDLPRGYELRTGYIFGTEIVIEGADLSGFDLTGLEIAGANLNNCDLTNANLGELNLSDTSLYGSTLTGANLTGANLQGAYLSGVKSGGIFGQPTNLIWSYRVQDGFLLGPEVNLAGADLRNISTNDSFSFQSANLSGANLSGLDLSDRNFWSANLSGANLSHAKVANAIFTDANLTNVNASGVTGFPQTLPPVWNTLGEAVGQTSLQPTSPPTISAAHISQGVKASTGTWPSQTTFEYQWFRDDVAIVGDFGDTFTPQPADLGHRLRVQVTATLNPFLTTSIKSENVVVGLKVFTTKTPTISGSSKVGKTLTATSSSWVAGSSLKYQWLLDSKPIKGATKKTLKIGKAQKGHKISVQVTQTAQYYLPATKTSKALKVS